MKNLHKHFLDNEKTFSFFSDSLENANTLSSEVLNSIAFKDGHFFTLLPEDANLERLYEFKWGAILPQNPRIRHENSNGYYSIKPTIREELSFLIREKIISNDNLISIFDNFLSKKLEKSQSERYLSLYYQKEIYHVGTKSNVSTEVIKSYLWVSNAFWHSLCILTRIDIQYFENEKLSLEDIVKICQNAELIFIRAYDGEGYVFWEKHSGFFP